LIETARHGILLVKNKGVMIMSLGERIQQLRKARGLSQEQLADSLNVSRQAISKWETDQSSPEIGNILALSSVFSVSTDELLGNDKEGYNVATAQPGLTKKKWSIFTSMARGFIKIMDSKIIFLIFTISCVIAVGTCIIVNFAIDSRITWAAYPILSVLVGWLIITPSLFRKYIWSMCMSTLLVVPFLYLLEMITPVHDWFLPVGLPAAIVGIVYVWVIYILFRYIKMSLWYKFAITVILSGVVDNLIINHFVDAFLNTQTSHLQYFISVFSYTVVFVLLLIMGYSRKKMKNADA